MSVDEVTIKGHCQVVRTGRYPATLRWCATHGEAAWEHEDGSVACPYDLIVESSNKHVLVDPPWELYAKEVFRLVGEVREALEL